MMDLCRLWESQDEQEWKSACDDQYWKKVEKDKTVAIEREMEELNANDIARYTAAEFLDFLEQRYFLWKFTDKRWLVTHRRTLLRHRNEPGGMDDLASIHQRFFSFPREDIKQGLEIACKIHGLGPAGASGLLAVLFPEHFGTVDRFVVEALRKISAVATHPHVQKINPAELKLCDGVCLIQIMRDKAAELNASFSTAYWTPRRIDKILWANRD